MCAEAIVEASAGGKKMCGEAAIRSYLDKCVCVCGCACVMVHVVHVPSPCV
jgi:hypothetical protein